ncbi:hypothetical protein BH11BAC1_BH11BAC1_21470 [soil metagenome]
MFYNSFYTKDDNIGPSVANQAENIKDADAGARLGKPKVFQSNA